MMAVCFGRSMQLLLKLLGIYVVSDGMDVGFIPVLLLYFIYFSAIFYTPYTKPGANNNGKHQ
jgi:hypothetical protein